MGRRKHSELTEVERLPVIDQIMMHKEEIQALAEQGFSRKEIAYRIGLEPSTFYSAYRRSKELQEIFNRADEVECAMFRVRQ